MSVLLVASAMASTNINSGAGNLRTAWANNTGQDQVVGIQTHLFGLNAGAGNLTFLLKINDDGLAATEQVYLAVVPKTATATQAWSYQGNLYLPSVGKILLTVQSDDAGDTAVTANTYVFSLSVATDVLAVAGATPQSFDGVPSNPTVGSRDDLLIRSGPIGRR